jgi:hypothetical protein
MSFARSARARTCSRSVNARSDRGVFINLGSISMYRGFYYNLFLAILSIIVE